jgi:hypothetical protein
MDSQFRRLHGEAFARGRDMALTDAINKRPFVPGRIGQLELFREQGIFNPSVVIEEPEGSLNLVETTARGAPAIQNTTGRRFPSALASPWTSLRVRRILRRSPSSLLSLGRRAWTTVASTICPPIIR